MGMKLDPETERKALALAGQARPPLDAPGPSEKEFQADVVRYARRLGWMVYHTYSSKRSDPGFPDLCMVKAPVGDFPGRVLFRELKVGDNQVTAEQAEWLCELRASGADAKVWREVEWAEVEKELGGGG